MAKGVTVDFTANLAKFEKGINTAVGKLDKFESHAKRRTAAIKKAFVGLAGLVSVGLFAGAVRSSLEFGDSIDKVSNKLGISTEALTRLQYAAKSSGVEFNTLALGLQRMERRVAEAAGGTGEAVKALDELGISAEKLNRLKPDEKIRILADAFSEIPNQSDRVRLAFKLFDSEGVNFLNFLQDGSVALDQFAQESDKVGNTLGKDQVEALTRANTAIDQFRLAAGGVANEFTVRLAPAIEAFNEFLRDNTGDIVNYTIKGYNALGQGVLNVAKNIANVLAFLADGLAQYYQFTGELFNSDIDLETSRSLLNVAESLGTLAAEVDDAKVSFQEIAPEQSRFNAELGKALPTLEGVAGRTLSLAEANKKNTTATKQATDAEKEKNRILNEGIAVWEDTRTESERLAIELERLSFLLDEGAIDWATYGRAVSKANENLEEKAKETAGNVNEFYAEAARSMERSFSDFFFDGMNGNLDDFAANFASTIQRMAADLAASEIMTLIAGEAFGRTGDVGGSLLGTVFDFFGKRAAGGPVSAGKPYIVGEKGPEVIVPGQSGTVVPNHALGGQNVTVNINTIDSKSFLGNLSTVRQEIASMIRQTNMTYNMGGA